MGEMADLFNDQYSDEYYQQQCDDFELEYKHRIFKKEIEIKKTEDKLKQLLTELDNLKK